ncbi:ADP-ribosylglycohydrolase family protein [Helcococcus kunzii]|uniref:ADP-ribosylglycohydrolase family protein n=1 Tax=Helcococcus kunzii TaxID=40091 RepID=UPI0024AD1DAB|nr:ADP-ribosylglycohydrolase family protein [Helcococcus kunzii]
MDSIKERIYSGILGKAIGVRLGAPIESVNWTQDLIFKMYGNIDGYIKDSKKFAADDDTNCPIFFSRALLDYGQGLTSEKLAWTWLNYTREYQGMFWWGGVGVSTEHTAYENLKKGIFPPLSGSQKINGKALSEQIGGQIFVDSWGLINLGNIEKAMLDAEIAASVSHDGEAIVGAKFIAGCISLAFEIKDSKILISKVLERLDQNSQYVKTLKKIYLFYLNHPNNFRKALNYVKENYGYDKFEGECHIIPNSCLVLIGLLYGNNDFNKSIEITCMCGWDTDSNAGVVGTIMGVMNGLDGINWKYRDAINDIIICSSMSPDLNITDLVDFTEQLWSIRNNINYKKSNKIVFEFPGSTRGLEIENDFRLVKDKVFRKSIGEFNILVDNLTKNDEAQIYIKTNYRKKDFPDNRYDPVLMPKAYPGDKFSFKVKTYYFFNKDLIVQGFIQLTSGEKIYCTDEIILNSDVLTSISFNIPQTYGIDIVKVGLLLKTKSELRFGCGLLSRFVINEIDYSRSSKGLIDFNYQENSFCDNVTPFSNSRISTSINNGKLIIKTYNKQGIALTGPYYCNKQRISGRINILKMGELGIAFRIKGLENYYYFRISEDYIALIRHYHLNDEIIAIWDNKLTDNLDYKLIVNKSDVSLLMNGEEFQYNNLEVEYGHYGFCGKNSEFELEEIYFEYY